uniref:WAPL domain-containing protein n=1 Tax=Mesocestoides corti TaxID=53468 RepID=A0A5K3EJ72_MESCO
MDIPYRTFATRSSRPNERFEQLSRGNVSGTTNGHSSRPPVSSSRKRVNVVTFRSTPSPVPTPDDVDKDVLPPLTKQPRCTTPVAVPPPAPLNIPTSVSTKHELRSGSENSLAATPLIAPKFRRVEYTSSQWRSPQLQSQSLENYKSSHRNGPTQVAPLKPSTANQRQKLPSSQPSKLPPPTTTNQKPEAADPYAWVEEEEPEPKPSEFAVREEDEVDDGVKPWFWPASREAAKQMTPSNTKATVKTDPRAINRIANDGGGAGGGDTKPRKIVVPRDQKSLYTVVEKVKDPSECQERGEVQHALDDMNYLIDGLSDTNSTNTRCLSVLTLANKCLTPATRDVIHAYGLLKQICANLHDAHTDYSLGLTAAGLFFVLSRDRDPDLLTSESLAVLLKLLHAPNTIMENASVDSATSTGSSKYTIGAASRQTRLNKEASQIRTRVQQLLEAVAAQQQKRSQKQQETPVKSPQPAAAAAGMAALFVRKNPGVASLFSGASGQKLLNARHLRMNRQLTARDLVLEAVLNLSTRKAAPWFKSGIRTGGGLDGVAEATIDAVDYLKDLCTADDPGKCRFLPTPATHNPTGLDDFSLDNLKRVGYYAKMLENMTYMNSDNQTHLVRYKERALIDRLVQCIHLCASRLPRHPPPSVAWVELLRKESEEKAAQVRSSGEDEREQQQPPTSSTEGEEFNKTSAASASPPTDEYQQDQQTLLTCLLSIFRLFVNVSHSGKWPESFFHSPALLSPCHLVLNS